MLISQPHFVPPSLICPHHHKSYPTRAAAMQSTTLLLAFVACITSTANANPAKLGARQNCGSSYSKCSPSGATSTNIPAVGSALSGLYVDVLDSINGVKFSKRGALDLAGALGIRSSPATVCCKPTLSRSFGIEYEINLPQAPKGPHA